MRKTYLITAILLLSAVWAVAQTSPSTPPSTTPDTSSQQSTTPSSTSPSQQPATPDSSTTTTSTTQTTQTSSNSATSIEGCLSGSAGNFSLTDQSGKTYQLAGDTSKLSDHVGHQVRIMGSDNSASGSSTGGASTTPSSTGAGSSSGSQSTFTVQKVKMISSTCATGK